VRRILGAGIAAVLLLAPLAACSNDPAPTETKDYLSMSWDQIVAEAKQEGELVVSAWWGEAFWNEAAKLFQDKYGIEVQFLLGNNAIDKILAEKDRAVGTIDVQLVGGQAVKTSVDADLWYGPVFSKLPDNSALDQKLSQTQEGVDTNGYLVPVYRNQTVIAYDPDKVSNPPQTWEEFVDWIDANPKQFAYPDPNRGGVGQAFIQAVIANLTGGLDQYAGDTEVVDAKVASWDAVWEWVRTYNEKMNVTVSNSEDLDLLNQGTASMVMAWDDDTQLALNNGSLFKRAKVYVPEFGLPGGGDTAGVLKNAGNKAAAILFLDFLTSKEIQALMNQTLGSIPARTDLAEVPSPVSETDRANSTDWLPAPYKEHLNLGFTEKVLLGS
jgi:putative spermidine/putrescine transport system substrate-binding protein